MRATRVIYNAKLDFASRNTLSYAGASNNGTPPHARRSAHTHKKATGLSSAILSFANDFVAHTPRIKNSVPARVYKYIRSVRGNGCARLGRMHASTVHNIQCEHAGAGALFADNAIKCSARLRIHDTARPSSQSSTSLSL